jgi:diguanylate cyclase (GGDEF)-like protein
VLRSGNLMGLFGVMLALNHVGTPSMAMVYFSIASGAILLSVILNSYNLAYLDELTELPSRRALKQQLMAMGKRYSIAMIDIDHFKQFNDRFGHDIGDQALRKVAKHLRQVTGGGKVYRFGGEEFTIVFSNKEAHEVLVHVDALREAIENNPFYVRSKRRPRTRPEEPVKPDKIRKVKITISAGIAQRAEQHTDPFEVIKSADKALYTAKRAGRNRVHAI